MFVSSYNKVFNFIIIIVIGKFINRYMSSIVADVYWMFIS